jgi:organic radical activating enzyme
MCFTGGEPLMKHAQDCTVGILDYFDRIKNSPKFITFETNATQALRPEFSNFMTNWREMGREIFISSSPKLWTTSGETNKDAIVPEVLAEYHSLSRGHGQIKYVVNGKKETWEEVDHVTNEFRKAGVTFPVWVMPVGATEEAQTGGLEGYMSAGAIAEEAFKRGFNVSARVHVYLWGNTIGV